MEILELGPGIHRSGDTTIAIDKNPKAQAEIIRDFAKRGIPFADDTFDEVRCYDVIEHIEMYDDLIFTFNEIWRVLKPKGLFHFTTPNGVEAGFAHITHHRVFVSGSFEYLKDRDDPEFQNMRISDGLVAKFNIEWVGRGDDQLEGKFNAVK